ncbi:MAG: hypothetical protein MUO78_10760 [candidate division Zixibacteria bacterium]|nr:hypothetical protein [candidate division Zixibacteria bacterium]
MSRFLKYFFIAIFISLLSFSCASKNVIQEGSQILPPLQAEKVAELPPELNLLPEMEGKVLKNRFFSFSAKETPLEDVLAPIASEAGLNIVWEKGVNPRASNGEFSESGSGGSLRDHIKHYRVSLFYQ